MSCINKKINKPSGTSGSLSLLKISRPVRPVPFFHLKPKAKQQNRSLNTISVRFDRFGQYVRFAQQGVQTRPLPDLNNFQKRVKDTGGKP